MEESKYGVAKRCDCGATDDEYTVTEGGLACLKCGKLLIIEWSK